MMRVLIKYRMCLERLQEIGRADELYGRQKYGEASEFYRRAVGLLERLPASEELFGLFRKAVKNELKAGNFGVAFEISGKQWEKFPESGDNVYLDRYIAGVLSGGKWTPRQEVYQPYVKAVDNILLGRSIPIIEEKDIGQNPLRMRPRQATVIGLSNYVTLFARKPQAQLQITKQDANKVLNPLFASISHTSQMDSTQLKNLPTNQLVQRFSSQQYHKLLSVLCNTLITCKIFPNSQVSWWLQTFLKSTQTYHKHYLFRPLYMLAQFHRANSKPMIAQGLLTTAINCAHPKYNESQLGMLLITKASLIRESQRRTHQASKLFQQGKSKYNFERTLAALII